MKLDKKGIDNLLNRNDDLTLLSKWSNNGDGVIVSIHCFVYNQDSYVSRCLDSFLNQFVNFNVEILVHDDCSNDNSRKVIEAYCNKYPNIIIPIYEKANIYSKTGNFLEIAEKMNIKSKGKYIALCEGDDYWSDQYKLYLQTNIMENNNKFHFCVHKVAVETTNDNIKSTYLPSFKLKTKSINSKKFIMYISDKYNFQTSSYFFRKTDYDLLFGSKPDYYYLMTTDDEVLLRHFGSLGIIAYINRPMSVYQQFTSGSWSESNRQNTNKQTKIQRYIVAVESFDNYTDGLFHKSCEYAINKQRIYLCLSRNDIASIFKNKKLIKTLWKMDKRFFISLFMRKHLRKIKII